MTQLQQFYEEHFAPNYLPAEKRPAFDQITDLQKRALENSLSFAGWKFNKAWRELGNSIVEALPAGLRRLITGR